MNDVHRPRRTGLRPKVARDPGLGPRRLRRGSVGGRDHSYADLPGFPQPTVGGHAGRLVLGHVGPTPVAVLQGRAHYYERGKADEMRAPIEAVAELGCETLLQTNAAGSLRLDMPPGSVMAISDHINFAGINPLFGIGPGDSRFVDMVDAYDPALRTKLMEAARKPPTWSATRASTSSSAGRASRRRPKSAPRACWAPMRWACRRRPRPSWRAMPASRWRRCR